MDFDDSLVDLAVFFLEFLVSVCIGDIPIGSIIGCSNICIGLDIVAARCIPVNIIGVDTVRPICGVVGTFVVSGVWNSPLFVFTVCNACFDFFPAGNGASTAFVF